MLARPCFQEQLIAALHNARGVSGNLQRERKKEREREREERERERDESDVFGSQ
jgi:hypothetical protein